MWKNKSTWKKNRGDFTNRRQGRLFGRRDQQHDRYSRRGEGQRTEYEQDRQSLRNVRQEAREYSTSEDRYSRSAVHIGIEIADEAYNRDGYQDVSTTGYGVHDEVNDDSLYRDHDTDRRNVEPNLGHYDEIGDRDNNRYWDNVQTQEVDGYHHRDQELKSDEYYGSRDHRGFVDDKMDRFDRDFQNDRSEVRVEGQHHDRQGSYRDRGTHHCVDSTRNQNVPSATFGQDDVRGYDNRSPRHTWKDQRASEKNIPFRTANIKDYRQDSRAKQSGEFQSKSHYNRKHDSSATRSTVDDKSKKHKSSTTSLVKGGTGSKKRTKSGDRNSHNIRGDSRHELKKSEEKAENKSSLTATNKKTSVGGKNSQKMDKNIQKSDKNSQKSSDSKAAVSKHDSNKLSNKDNSGSVKKKGDPKKQMSSSIKDENSSFKKPLDKQHQHKQRNNSGRKAESESGHVHEEDILSIMADDDGFEREMRIDSRTGGNHSGSRNRSSRERVTEASDAGRRSSRDRERFGRHEYDKDNNIKQNSTSAQDSNIEPLFEIHADASTSFYGESNVNEYRSSELRSSNRRSDTRRNRQSAYSSRHRIFGNKDFRHSGSNNNYLGGRSRLSVASKIKDSYLKRQQTYQKFGYRGTNNQQRSKLVNVYNQKHLPQQTNGKNEIGKTGAVLKDDRVRDNNRSSNLSDRERSRSADKRSKENNFDSNSRSFSLKQSFDRNVQRNKFHRDRPTFKSRGVAFQRVKRKYFRGAYNNGSNRRSHSDRGKEYNREENQKERHWSERSVVNKNIYSDELRKEDLPDNDQQLDNVSQDSSQPQVIFIPNSDLQTGQPHMIDQFGQIIVNPDDVPPNDAQVPVQYLPQQFHPDGDQVVFIPFVNNQMQPGYSDNLALGNNEGLKFTNEVQVPVEKENKNNTTTDTKAASQSKKPLSKGARSNMRRLIARKQKLRMEKAIEQKILTKLLKNPTFSKAVTETNFDKTKKKPVIKRISPPGSNKTHHSNKTLKVVRKGNNKDEFEDVSEDEGKYDRVSDLEDVSEYEYMSDGHDGSESGQLKRPGFRKPGQPRMRKSVEDSSGNRISKTTDDIRKVVDHGSSQIDSRSTPKSYNQPARLKQVDVRNQRSVYIEKTNPVIGHKRGNDVYENKIVKKRRSISPIEITVSNDHYSKVITESSQYENSSTDDYKSRKRTTDTYRSSGRHEGRKSNYAEANVSERSTEGRYDRTRNERKGEYKNLDERQYNDKERWKKAQEEKGNKMTERNNKSDRNEEKFTRNERSYYSSNETEEKTQSKPTRFSDREQRSMGKYEVKKGNLTNDEKDRVEYRRERSYNKNDDVNKHERNFRSDERRHLHEDRKDNRYSDRKRNEVGDQELHRSNEEFELTGSDMENRNRNRNREGSRNEGKRSLSRDRNTTETRNFQTHDRHRTNLSEDGSSRNITNTTFVSSMNMGQFQRNQPLMQQSMQPQTFITAQSQSVPVQFSNSNNIVDHSLPPVQNSPISMPPMPPPSLGIRPDMSLPPPLMNVVGTPTSMVIQQPNNVQFQQQSMQQIGMQQQIQQQQFQNMQSQLQQQQQFHQMQQQPQMVQQQPGSQQFQSPQSMYQNNLQSNQQMSLQQINSGQFQQNQNVGMLSVNQNVMQGRVSQQSGSMNQSTSQGLGTSMNPRPFIAGTPQQAVRGLLGRVRVAAPMNQVSNSPTMSRRSGLGGNSNYREDIDEEEDEYLTEMLCSKCDKVFLSHEVVRRHGRWHDMIESNTKTWRCDQCEQGFTSSTGYTEHMSTKHSRDSWNCSLCDMTFSNSSGLNKHVRLTSHQELKVKFVCSLCPASFMVLTHLVQHKKENHQSNMGYSGLRRY